MATTTNDRMATLRAFVREQAENDAKLFVDEFSEPIDTASTDWDATAWDDVGMSLRYSHDLTTDEADELWPFYQETLAAETLKLCSEDSR